MALSLLDLEWKEQIYQCVGDDGIHTCVAINRLYKWVQANKKKLEIQLVPVDPGLAASFIKDNVVSRERIMELIHRTDLEPIIWGKDGTFTEGRPDVFLMDGHHRYALHAAARVAFIKSYVLEMEQWEAFRITDAPEITQDQLRDVPILRRLY
jgi:hypothetical protein